MGRGLSRFQTEMDLWWAWLRGVLLGGRGLHRVCL